MNKEMNEDFIKNQNENGKEEKEENKMPTLPTLPKSQLLPTMGTK